LGGREEARSQIGVHRGAIVYDAEAGETLRAFTS
jgi:hypothetical protein